MFLYKKARRRVESIAPTVAKSTPKVNGALEFQVVDVIDRNETIYVFGRTRHGDSLCLCVLKFRHYFYASYQDEVFLRVHGDDVDYDDNFDDSCTGEPQKKKTRCGGGGDERLDAMMMDILEERGPREIYCVTRLRRDKYKPFDYYTTQFLSHVYKVELGSHFHRSSEVARALKQSFAAFARSSQGRAFDASKFRLFETDTQIVHRFMLDSNIRCGGWYAIDIDALQDGRPLKRQSNCVHEYVVVDYNTARRPWWSIVDPLVVDSVAPFVFLGLDIECSSSDGRFPDAQFDGVIHVGLVRAVLTPKGIRITRRVDILLGDVAPCPESDIEFISVSTELSLFERLAESLLDFDPDFIIGYNVNNFDWRYLYTRAKVLEIPAVPHLCWGRLVGVESTQCITHFSSNQSGNQERTVTEIFGRVSLDIYQEVTARFKLRSYKLDDVAFHFLRKHKDNVPATMIGTINESGPAGRLQIGRYCVRDAELPLLLAQKIDSVLLNLQYATLTYLTVNNILRGGQQIKVLNLIRLEIQDRARSGMKTAHYLIPERANGPDRGGGHRASSSSAADRIIRLLAEDGDDNAPSQDQSSKKTANYTGAVVIEPDQPYYNTPVLVYDFNSLYPSIMITTNICRSTHVRSRDCPTSDLVRDPSNMIVCESGERFVHPRLTLGIVPSVCMKLLGARKAVRAQMKAYEKTDFVYKIFDTKQLALKILANSVYGALGAPTFILFRTCLAESVCLNGQQLLRTARHAVQTKYFQHSQLECVREQRVVPSVCYGDTDSIFVFFKDVTTGREYSGPETTDTSTMFAEGDTMMKFLNSTFPATIQFAFEKMYTKLLLAKRKKYIGLKMEYLGGPLEREQRGIETVRRDNCVMLVNLMDACIGALFDTGDSAGKVASSSSSWMTGNKLFDELERIVRPVVAAIKENRVPLENLIVGKVYRGDSVHGNIQPHCFVVRKMKARDPASAPKSGERVNYVIVSDKDADAAMAELGGIEALGAKCRYGEKNKLLYTKAEDPNYVRERPHILPDAAHYVRRLKNPIFGIFGPFLDENLRKRLAGLFSV